MKGIFNKFNFLFPPKTDKVAEEHADAMFRSIFFESNTEYQLKVFNSLERKFHNEMKRRFYVSQKETSLISEFYNPVKKEIVKVDINNPDFHKPIAQVLHKSNN